MNRKFKVWSSIYNRFLDSSEVALRADGYILVYDYASDGVSPKQWGPSWERPDSFRVCFDTGYTDLKNRPIYEGDMITHPRRDRLNRSSWHYVYEIGYYNGSIFCPYVYQVFSDENAYVVGRCNTQLPDLFSECLIVGNIYENPLNITR